MGFSEWDAVRSVKLEADRQGCVERCRGGAGASRVARVAFLSTDSRTTFVSGVVLEANGFSV